MKNHLFFLSITIFFSLFWGAIFSQEDHISIDTINFDNSALLFQAYEPFGKHCKNNNGVEKYCLREEKLLDNNIEELSVELENTLSYLEIQYELISKELLKKEIYSDKKYYRYLFISKATLSRKGNSCFSNPGALIFHYILYDRLEDKKYSIDIDYAFYICDIQILVNDINKNLRKKRKKLNSSNFFFSQFF